MLYLNIIYCKSERTHLSSTCTNVVFKYNKIECLQQTIQALHVQMLYLNAIITL